MMNSLPNNQSDIRGSDVSRAKQAQQKRRCIYCGQYAELVWVHGHGQCSACGINTEECCRGESCAFDQNQ